MISIKCHKTAINRGIATIIIFSMLSLLTACTTKDLNTPCPTYGASCHKVSINTWK